MFITRWFNWALLDLLGFKRQDTRQNVLSFTLLLFPITQGIFFPKFLARIRSWKPYLTVVCGYKQVLGLLQVGRSRCTCYPDIIETPVNLHLKLTCNIIRYIQVKS